MTACERCWAMARNGADYHRLLQENACTPEEQAGPDATRCLRCDRATCHQITGQCMVCGWESLEAAKRGAT